MQVSCLLVEMLRHAQRLSLVVHHEELLIIIAGSSSILGRQGLLAAEAQVPLPGLHAAQDLPATAALHLGAALEEGPAVHGLQYYFCISIFIL